MRYYQFGNGSRRSWLGVEVEPDAVYNLSSIHSTLTEFGDLLKVSSLFQQPCDEIVRSLLKGNRIPCHSLNHLQQEGWRPARPLTPPEVWAAGVTYQISREERQKESRLPKVYAEVYDAERPELFFKATADRCVGPFEAIGVRGDSEWSVPEPELAFVLQGGEIVAYTIGNDVSSRSIEGENPLYLPQAKIYRRCCAIGPCLVTPESLPDPHDLEINCEIRRDGKIIFQERASTSQMVRRCRDLASFLLRHNNVPEGTVVLTGTAIVPPEEITLLPNDRVRIIIEKIGTLENTVIGV